MTRGLVIMTLATLLAGCGEVAVRPSLAPLDLTLTRPCDAPVSKPAEAIGPRRTVELWGRDRLALRDCGRRHAATVEIIERRDAALGGN